MFCYSAYVIVILRLVWTLWTHYRWIRLYISFKYSLSLVMIFDLPRKSCSIFNAGTCMNTMICWQLILQKNLIMTTAKRHNYCKLLRHCDGIPHTIEWIIQPKHEHVYCSQNITIHFWSYLNLLHLQRNHEKGCVITRHRYFMGWW